MLSIKGLTLHENLLKFAKKQKITNKRGDIIGKTESNFIEYKLL
jgi:hypothetical protein